MGEQIDNSTTREQKGCSRLGVQKITEEPSQTGRQTVTGKNEYFEGDEMNKSFKNQ